MRSFWRCFVSIVLCSNAGAKFEQDCLSHAEIVSLIETAKNFIIIAFSSSDGIPAMKDKQEDVLEMKNIQKGFKTAKNEQNLMHSYSTRKISKLRIKPSR